MSKPLVSSFTMALKKATTVTEDVAEAKKEHRQHLQDLIAKYKEDVVGGKAEGIRTAKELVEIIKLDLLLMGEATDRTENSNNPIDDAQLVKITSVIDETNPEIQALIDSMFKSLNEVNDNLDNTNSSVSKESITEEVSTEEVNTEEEEKEEE